MKKRPLAIRAAAAAIAVVALTAIAIPLLTTSAGASAWTPPTSPTTTLGASGFNECPTNIGQSTEGCAVLIVLPASGPAQILQNTHTDCGTGSNKDCNGPFDGHDDTLVGIVNETNVAIPTVALSSSTDIFAFDGDGICSGYGSWTGSTGCPYGTTGYEGPGTSFNGYSSSTHYKVGNVNFSSGGLGAGSSTFFSLESNLSGATFTVPASFVVTKSASPSGVIAGDASTPITYTLTATNLGNAAGDVTISDGIPTGTTYVASSAACPTVTLPETCAAGESGGIVSYAIDDVPGGTTVAVTFQVTANASDETGTISNTAIWSGPGCTPPPDNGNTGSTGNTGDQVSAPVTAAVALVTCDTNTTTTTVTAEIPVTVTASTDTSVYGQTTPPVVTPAYSPLVTPATGRPAPRRSWTPPRSAPTPGRTRAPERRTRGTRSPMTRATTS